MNFLYYIRKTDISFHVLSELFRLISGEFIRNLADKFTVATDFAEMYNHFKCKSEHYPIDRYSYIV